MKYIHKEIGFYEVPEELSGNYKVGQTIEDYHSGMFVLLNELQLAFQVANPLAAPEINK